MTVDVENKNGVFFIKGDLTDACDFSTMGFRAGPVRLDMSGVRAVNSGGVRMWISALRDLKMQPIYMNCPPSIVIQFNMVPDFLANGARVESFLVPGFCGNRGKRFSFLLRAGKEFDPGTKPTFEVPKCAKA